MIAFTMLRGKQKYKVIVEMVTVLLGNHSRIRNGYRKSKLFQANIPRNKQTHKNKKTTGIMYRYMCMYTICYLTQLSTIIVCFPCWKCSFKMCLSQVDGLELKTVSCGLYHMYTYAYVLYVHDYIL